AMMILLCTQFFMRYAMRAMTDVPFTFFFELALFFYLIGLRRKVYLIFCGAAIGFAVLTRSFLGLIPLGIILAHLTVCERWAVLRSKHSIAGALLAIGLPFVWFVSQYLLHGSKFLGLHFSFTFDNLPLTNGKGVNQFGAGLFRYPLFLIKSYWPWLPLMVIGMWTQTRKAIKWRDSAGSLLVIWVLALIIPFSLAEFKWLRYILPAFPAFAILSAITLNDWIKPHRRRLFLKASYAVLCLTMVGMALNPKYRVRPEEMRRLAPVAESATIPERKILLYIERLHPYAHMYQIIWYADRYCELLANANEALAKLEREPNAAEIMDKKNFPLSIICEAAASDQTITILGQTERFICWTIDHQHHSEEK